MPLVGPGDAGDNQKTIESIKSVRNLVENIAKIESGEKVLVLTDDEA